MIKYSLAAKYTYNIAKNEKNRAKYPKTKANLNPFIK